MLGDLQGYCQAQYQAVNALCRVNQDYLKYLLPLALERDEEDHGDSPEERRSAREGDVLSITLDPSPAKTFREALRREGRAWIVEHHRDGRTVVRRWEAGKHIRDVERHREPAKSDRGIGKERGRNSVSSV